MDIFDVDVERLISAYRNIDDLTNYSERCQRQHSLQMVYYPKTGTFDLNGYDRDFHKKGVTLEYILTRIHPSKREDWKQQMVLLDSCTKSVVRFHTVVKPFEIDHYRIFSIQLSAVRDESGKIQYYIGFSNDISVEIYERQQFQHKEKRSENLRDYFKVSLWNYVPSKGMIYSDNPYKDAFFHDYTEEEFIHIIHPDQQADARKNLQNMRAGYFFKEPFISKIMMSDGKVRYFEVAPEEMREKDGNVVCYLFVCRDVTEEKEREFQAKTLAMHVHQVLNEIGIRLYRYVPGQPVFENNDMYAEKSMMHIPVSTILERMPEERREAFAQIFRRFDQRVVEKKEMLEQWRSFETGTMNLYRLSIIPVFNEKQELVEYGVIRYDVTKENEQRQLMHFLEDVGNAGAWVYRIEVKKSLLSEGACRILGVDYETGSHMSFEQLSECVAEEDRDDFIRNSYDIMYHKDVAVMHYRVRTPKGEKKFVEMSIRVDRLKDSTPYYAYGTFLDITERMLLKKKTEELSNLYKAITKVSPSAVGIKDADDDLKVIIANEAYANYFGKRVDEVIGNNIRDYCPSEENVLYEASDRQALAYTPDNPMHEMYAREVNGEKRYYQNTKFAQCVNGRNLLISIATDVTELQMAKEKAIQSDKLKSAFLANMSHEIRTPLNAIVGFSDLIVSNTSPEDNERFANIIHTNSDNLLHLIGDILDISKLEAGSMKFIFEDFDVCDMLDDIYTSMKGQFDAKGVDLIGNRTGIHCMVHQDRLRVTEIVNNFLTNALKHTDAGMVYLGKEIMGDRFKIYVTDMGRGIAKESLHSIFNRFEKLNEFKEGTGLGLAICQGLTKALGGNIGVDSELGKGSTFWVELPTRVYGDKDI